MVPSLTRLWIPLTSSALFQIFGLLDAQKLPFCNKQIHKYHKKSTVQPDFVFCFNPRLNVFITKFQVVNKDFAKYL